MLVICGKIILTGGTTGVYQADYFVSTDQLTPDWPVKILFLGEVETLVKLGIKSWFDCVGLPQIVTFWVCCLFFKNRRGKQKKKLTLPVSRWRNHVQCMSFESPKIWLSVTWRNTEGKLIKFTDVLQMWGIPKIYDDNQKSQYVSSGITQ